MSRDEEVGRSFRAGDGDFEENVGARHFSSEDEITTVLFWVPVIDPLESTADIHVAVQADLDWTFAVEYSQCFVANCN